MNLWSNIIINFQYSQFFSLSLQKGMHADLSFKKKKKSNKTVPMDELGFRAKVIPDLIDPKNLKRKVRNNYQSKKYTAENNKQNFIQRLKIIIDVNDLPPDTLSEDFKVSKEWDWQYVKKVIYPSRQKHYCSICLEENLIAPQITYCGHVFCFHCILTHFKKSTTNQLMCPVCKQFADKTMLKTCELIREKNLLVGDQIKMNLKVKSNRRIFNPSSSLEDPNFLKIVRMRTKGILPFFENEQKEILSELQKTAETQRNFIFLNEALELVKIKIEKTKKILSEFPLHIKLQKYEKIIDDVVYKCLQEDQKNCYFYQEESGRLIFLHNISKKYITSSEEKKILEFKSHIIEKEDIQFNQKAQRVYYELSHLTPNQQIELVIVDLQDLGKDAFNPQILEKYEMDLTKFQSQKRRIKEEQEQEAKRLNEKYEKQQAYIRQIKKFEEAQYPVKAPVHMDPSEMNEEHTFPSLITSKSEEPVSIQKQEKKQKEKHPQEQQKKQKQKVLQINSFQDFPDLNQLKSVKSETVGKNGKGGRKKKKQKRIDITHEIFGQDDQ